MKVLVPYFLMGLILSTGPLSAAELTNKLSPGLAYQNHPLNYWLEGLAKWDARAEESTKAIKSLGMPSVPLILHYSCLRKDGTTNQSDTGRAVARACRLLDEGKSNRALEKLLRNGLKDTDPQVRMNSMAGLPLSEKFVPDLEKLCKDSDLQVRVAATNSLTHWIKYNDWLKHKSAEEPKPQKPAAPRLNDKH